MHSPGFAHELETFVDHPSGVTFQDSFFRGRGREIVPPKVLSYRPSVVLSFLGPWRALFSRARHATALGSQGITCRILGLGGISMAVGYLATFGVIAANTEEAVSSLNAVIAAGLFFLLGPFVSTAVSRFWTVRKDCIGGLWGAVDDLSAYAAAWFASKSVADRAARALVLRLGLCSHALLYKQVRTLPLVGCGVREQQTYAPTFGRSLARSLRPSRPRPHGLYSVLHA